MISLLETPKAADSAASKEESSEMGEDSMMREVKKDNMEASNSKPQPRLSSLKGLSEEERGTLLSANVALMGLSVDADALNAVLRLLLRLTQDFDQAVTFAEMGGVKMLLDLTQASSFSGFSSLATLLIRHVMEDPVTLRQTMEKVIRSSTINSSASNTKELHYLLRMLAPAACRSPALFAEVTRQVLRVDFNLLKKTGEIDEDKRLLLKSLPAKLATPANNPLHEVSRSVICDLLNFLVRSTPPGVTEVKEATEVNVPNDVAHKQTTSGTNRTQVIVRNSSSGELQVSVPEGAVPPAEAAAALTSNKELNNEDEEVANKKRPLMTKASICRLLAELVKSYGNCACLITEHIFEAGMSELVKEDTTALAFLLDELLISKAADKECSNLVKTLVAALASCNHYPDAQTTLVLEVKGALARALTLQESADKHAKIQSLTSLICTMIESCPSSQTQAASMALYRQLQYNMNNMVKIMLKKGIITDLARVSHSLDLSSPNVSATVNAVLKPLETLSRIVNQPTGLSSHRVSKNKANVANGNSAEEDLDTRGSAPGGGAGTNTTNSEATRAQGDETVEPDPEATEHDISTAAESIDPNSESQLHVRKFNS
jgi:E3 ubiquitin-protein ligase HUWE1